MMKCKARVSWVTSTILALLLSARTSVVSGQNSSIVMRAQAPTQTFFVPLYEQQLLDLALAIITPNVDKGAMISILAFGVTTDNTVIWYDHREDGYEVDPAKPDQTSTEIWGDGNARNGCAPQTYRNFSCTDASDRLMAGNTIQVENTINLPRDNRIAYDGGDMIHASFPITVTRTGYSRNPGSVLAGGIEVFDTSSWGTNFVVPLGQSMVNDAWSLTTCHIMAKEQTTVIIDGKTSQPYLLDKGGSAVISIGFPGTTITSTKPIQVAMITGASRSLYGMRWFSLQPVDQWDNDYLTPVGDDLGKSRMIFFNANRTSDIIVQVERLSVVTGTYFVTNVTVKNMTSEVSPWIPTGCGARATSLNGEPFNTLAFTDTEGAGVTYDWGFPVVAVQSLTPQVVIGLGFGCTTNDCGLETARSPVWVTPIENAFIYIDYKNSGIASEFDILRVRKYESIRVRARNERKDMSGALIFATKWDGTATQVADPSGQTVDIASAWGQDPSVSGPRQEISLDMGTVVVPFTTIRASKHIDVVSAVPGTTVTYTIRVMCVGQTNLPVNAFTIFDPVLNSAVYVPGSTRYSPNGGITFFNVPDSRIGTLFPLDEGLPSMFPISRRGGVHDVTFVVTVDPLTINSTELVNSGHIHQISRPDIPFFVRTPFLFLPSVTIVNTLYLGNNDGKSCDISVDRLSGNIGNDVTYCFVVTNDGNTFLKVDINNTLLNYNYSIPQLLKPGESVTLAVPRSIAANLTNVAIATGTPAFFDGRTIPSVSTVTSRDPSSLDVTVPRAQVTISNTVIQGVSPGISQSCSFGGAEIVTGDEGSDVTYCLRVTNTGNTYLDNVTVTDPAINFTRVRDTGLLAPGATFTIAVPRQLLITLTNTAFVTGVPVLVDRSRITTQPPVSAQDDSRVVGITVRSGDKDPFIPKDPGGNGTLTKCMLQHWQDKGKTSGLSCSAKEVFLDNVKNRQKSRCVAGKSIKVDISADVVFRSDRYDPAFFVALDGGDAMTGTCSLNAFEANQNYIVVDPDNNKTVVGKVLYDQDFRGGNDPCGDVFIFGGGAGMIRRIIVDREVICTDYDNDGSLDIAVCFSWRVRGTDGACTLTPTDAKTTGSLANVAPGTPSKCFCYRYNVPEINVDTPSNPIDVC